MSAKDQYLCIVLEFTNEEPSHLYTGLWRAALEMMERLGRQPTHLDFATDKFSGSRQPWRFSKRNTNRLLSHLKSEQIQYLDLYSVGDDQYLVDSPVGVGVDYRGDIGIPGRIVVQIMDTVINLCRIPYLEFDKIVTDFCRDAPVRYGLIHFMEGSKFPGAYFRGSNCTGCLTRGESRNNELWEETRHRFQELVRGVYWGNLLSSGHWGHRSDARDRLVSDLRQECKANVTELDAERILFTAPFDPFDAVRFDVRMVDYSDIVTNVLIRNGVEIMCVEEERKTPPPPPPPPRSAGGATTVVHMPDPEEPVALLGSPPDYLAGKVTGPDKNGVAGLLMGGQWCGHGERRIAVFDVKAGDSDVFEVYISSGEDADQDFPFVQVSPAGRPQKRFSIYDARRHPASFAYEPEADSGPQLDVPFTCPRCRTHQFRVAVGFEVPADSQAPNDTSWLALALRCMNCEFEGIVYEDETA